MLKQFSASNKSMEDAIVTMKKSLQEKEKELAEVRAEKAVVQTKNEEMQILLDRANVMAKTVPELKKKIEELEKCEEVCKAQLGEANKQLVDMRIQHLQMEENLARLVHVGEKERQEIEDNNMRLLKEMEAKHLVEEKKLQVQIAAAKQVSVQSLMESLKLLYEQDDEGYKQEALGKPPTRQDDEEEGSADSSASTETFVPQRNEESEVDFEEGLVQGDPKERGDIYGMNEDDVDDLLGPFEDEDVSFIAKKPERLSDQLQSMITTNDQPSSSLERTTSCRRKKLIRGDEKSGGSQVKVEPATDATGLKEAGEGLQSRKTVDEVQKTSAEEEDTSVTEESQLRRSSRKRSMSRRSKEASDDSREENTPMEQKQRLEAGVGAKKTKMGNLRKCDLGGACVACNTPECGKCKFCLDK